MYKVVLKTHNHKHWKTIIKTLTCFVKRDIFTYPYFGEINVLFLYYQTCKQAYGISDGK